MEDGPKARKVTPQEAIGPTTARQRARFRAPPPQPVRRSPRRKSRAGGLDYWEELVADGKMRDDEWMTSGRYGPSAAAEVVALDRARHRTPCASCGTLLQRDMPIFRTPAEWSCYACHQVKG